MKHADFSSITPEEADELFFHLACRLDDFKKEIIRDERGQSIKRDRAREVHANLARLLYSRIKPSALCGDLKLLDGTTLRKPAKGSEADA